MLSSDPYLKYLLSYCQNREQKLQGLEKGLYSPGPVQGTTHDVTTTTADPSGGVTTVLVSTPIKSTSPGCEKPLIHEWGTQNGGVNLTLKNCIDDPDSVGFKEEDSAQVNWNRIMIHRATWKARLSRAAGCRGEIQLYAGLHRIAKGNDILRAAAFGLPTTATFAETNAKLPVGFDIFQRNEVAEAIKIQTMDLNLTPSQMLPLKMKQEHHPGSDFVLFHVLTLPQREWSASPLAMEPPYTTCAYGNPSKPSIVLVHGGLLTSQVFENLVPYITKTDLTIPCMNRSCSAGSGDGLQAEQKTGPKTNKCPPSA
ncbi:hypothetical protein C8J56DRAFT_1092197 [Mycena floridula]|nr:hypothetical protein C8J56DRAFT_1092197 [Mycena floridula]